MNKVLLAKIISTVFNPVVFIFILPFLVIYKYTGSSLYALKWQLFTFIFIFLAGVLFIIGRIKGNFSDEDVSVRRERHKLFIIFYIMALLYFLASILLKGFSFPLSIITFGIMLGILVFNFVNYYIKASIHVGVALAFAITAGFLYNWIYSLILLGIVLLVSWSRIIIKRHIIKEVIIGGILGGLITLITLFIGKEIYNY